jgi:hypothetical protein
MNVKMICKWWLARGFIVWLTNTTSMWPHHTWLHTAAALVRAQVWSCGICGGQSVTGTDLLQVLRFPLSSSVIWGRYSRPVVAAVPSWLSVTPLRIIKKKHENNTMLFDRGLCVVMSCCSLHWMSEITEMESGLLAFVIYWSDWGRLWQFC